MARYSKDGILRISSYNDIMRIMLDINNTPIDALIAPLLSKKDPVSRLLEAQDVIAERITLSQAALSACFSSIAAGSPREEAQIIEYRAELNGHIATAYNLQLGIQKELERLAVLRQARNSYVIPKEIGAVISRSSNKGVEAKWVYTRINYPSAKGYCIAYRVVLKSARSILDVTLNADEPPKGYFDTRVDSNRNILVPLEIETDFCFYVIPNNAHVDRKEGPWVKSKTTPYKYDNKTFIYFVGTSGIPEVDNTRIEPTALEQLYMRDDKGSMSFDAWVFQMFTEKGLKL